ncbi:MAG TPA: DUF2891 domain-containing protein [Casimicrobiaceae bacterium]|nr:DUF2891 domain-containing protein [Casimicrobiaceae bacterium]
MVCDALLDAQTASRFATLALANIARHYPHKLDHTMSSDADAQTPRVLHPAFHGSYDWHSCVHMHWLLARVLRRFPALPERATIEALFDRQLHADAIAVEVAYLARPESISFERTYGWAWLLKLAAEIAELRVAPWHEALAPLAGAFAGRFIEFLPRAHYPVRYGMHANSAFALAFALDYADVARDTALADACRTKAIAWFAHDRDAPAQWEPSGTDFLSPVLVEAELMRRVLDAATFAEWLAAFLPTLGEAQPAQLLTPATVTDRDDAQLVHLDGLNLSRAWCFRGIARALPPDDPRVAVATAAAQRHLAAGWQGLASHAFVGAHWLASFAALALEGAGPGCYTRPP